MRIAATFAAGAMILGLTTGLALAQSADPKKGREIFVKYGCFGCHGFDGQGGVAGPKLAPEPMAADAMIAYLRNAGDTTRMPPYDAKNLPDGDILHIRAYLTTIPKTGDWKSNPLLKN